MSELRTIRLYGHLGKHFGRVHHRAIRTPGEAVRSLCATIPGFREYVEVEHGQSAFRVLVGQEAIGEGDLKTLSGGQEISIVPVVRGGKSNLGRVVIGAALIVASFYSEQGWMAKMAFSIGASEVLGGVAGLLSHSPSPYAYNAGEDNGTKNYLFSGANQSTKAGSPVPVLYGELEIPCVPISTGVRSNYGSMLKSHFGMLGDGAGTWSGDGNTTPLAASKSESEYKASFIETAMLQFALSEGPCAGLVNGWQSIKLDGTPVLASDGTTWNFTGISAALVNGTSTQEYIPGFADVETETSAGGEIKYDQPQFITINDLNTSSVRVKITFPALQQIDQTTGKAKAATVSMGIDVQASGGSYVPQDIVGKISDSTSGETSRAFLIPLTGTGPWSIRVRRVTADSTDTYVSNKSYLGSYTEIKDAKLRHPWTAKLALGFSADRFSSLPAVTVHYRGRIIQVPSNYDPIARTYTGSWDGTFKAAWSNNPAWCFLDMATHKRYGAGRYMAQAGIDVWTLYEIAQYCDELVSNGMGGTEPRAQFNAYLSSTEDAFKVLAHIISVARAVLYYGCTPGSPSTSLTAVQDKLGTAISLFSPSNVIDGKFTYAGTPRKTRYTEVTVWWNDPAQAYKLVPVLVVADASYIARYGVQSFSTTAFGATTKAQAIREGRRILMTNLLETETIEFSSGLEGMVAYPGALIQVKDPARDKARQGGRLLEGCTTNTLYMDGEITLAPGTAYTAYVTLPNGSVESRPVTTGAGTVSYVTLASALSVAPNADSQWQITPTATTPTRWRILTVKENRTEESLTYEITAIQNAPEKYSLIDDVGTIVATHGETPATFAPVTNLALTSNTAWSNGNAVITLQASWTAPAGATGAEAIYRLDGGAWQSMAVSGASASATIASVGVCDVRVFATYARGNSGPVQASYTAAGIVPTTPSSLTLASSVEEPEYPPEDPTTVRLRGADNGDIIVPGDGKDPIIRIKHYLTFTWTHTDASPFALKGFRIALYDGSDPNDTSKYWIPQTEVGPYCRKVILAATSMQEVTFNAAVQALYLDGNESAWRLASGAVVLDPDTIQVATASALATTTAKTDAVEAIVAGGKYEATSVGYGSWTVPAGVTRVRLVLVSGGKGGTGGTAGRSASGSYAGQAVPSAAGGVIERYLAVTPGDVLTYNVGDGGAGSAGATASGAQAAAGTMGGSTTLTASGATYTADCVAAASHAFAYPGYWTLKTAWPGAAFGTYGGTGAGDYHGAGGYPGFAAKYGPCPVGGVGGSPGVAGGSGGDGAAGTGAAGGCGGNGYNPTGLNSGSGWSAGGPGGKGGCGRVVIEWGLGI